MTTVERTYQLGGGSTFEARDREHLIRIIRRDAADMRRDGDHQGIEYSVASESDARALGCYETVCGDWVIEGTMITIVVDDSETP